MAEHLPDHLSLGDGGNDLERATLAQGTGAQLQGKHPLEEPRPAPVWAFADFMSNLSVLLDGLFARLGCQCSTTAMFCSNSCGRLCRSCRYSGLLYVIQTFPS